MRRLSVNIRPTIALVIDKTDNIVAMWSLSLSGDNDIHTNYYTDDDNHNHPISAVLRRIEDIQSATGSHQIKKRCVMHAQTPGKRCTWASFSFNLRTSKHQCFHQRDKFAVVSHNQVSRSLLIDRRLEFPMAILANFFSRYRLSLIHI